MTDEKKPYEEVCLVDDQTYLHLKEAVKESGFAYAAYDKKSGATIANGKITYEDMLDNPIRNPIACARFSAINEIGLEGKMISKVALRTLEKIQDARRSYRREHKDDSHDHSIRFITSSYDELFRIPNGGTVQVQYPDRSFIARCEYVDDYHTRVGNELFHICQFAELLERGGATVQPEPELLQEEAAWQVGHKEYLSIQESEDGWDYSLYNKNFSLIDGGQLDSPELSILQVRDLLLADLGMASRNLTMVNYEDVAERVEAVAEQSVLVQLREKQKTTVAAERPSSPKPKKEECL